MHSRLNGVLEHLPVICSHQIGLCFTLWRLLVQLEPALADSTHQPDHPARSHLRESSGMWDRGVLSNT